MRTCDECGVGFSGELDHCPLCGSALEGSPMPAAFPVSRAQQLAKAARRAVGTLAVAAVLLLLAAAWWFKLPLEAVSVVGAALAIGYLLLRKMLIRRQLAAEARRLAHDGRAAAGIDKPRTPQT